jgi:hypothetical protein
MLLGEARADGTPLEVVVGETVERDVDYARGWFCDDPSILDAALVTRDDRNIWRVTGVKVGTTLCRVGQVPYPPVYLFDVHVVAKKTRRAGS